MEFQVTQATVLRERRLLVAFSCPADALDPADPSDCLALSAWTLTGGRLARVLPAELDTATPSSVFLELDADPPGSTISVALSPLARSAHGQATSTTAIEVTALRVAPIGPQQVGQLAGDMALPIAAAEGGDVGMLGRVDALKARLLQSFSVREGAFAHLPGYGRTAEPKRTYSQGQIGQMASRLKTQLLQDPDVKAASVLAFHTAGSGVLRFDITVTDTFSGEKTTLSPEIRT